MSELKEYLHLYLPFDAKYQGRVVTITGIAPSSLGFATFYTRKEGFLTDNYNEIKLLLRPLSDMTEEEFEEFDDIPADIYRGGRFKVLAHEATSVKYLLSRGFDLFGLIEKGLALDKTKIKSPAM